MWTGTDSTRLASHPAGVERTEVQGRGRDDDAADQRADAGGDGRAVARGAVVDVDADGDAAPDDHDGAQHLDTALEQGGDVAEDAAGGIELAELDGGNGKGMVDRVHMGSFQVNRCRCAKSTK